MIVWLKLTDVVQSRPTTVGANSKIHTANSVIKIGPKILKYEYEHEINK